MKESIFSSIFRLGLCLFFLLSFNSCGVSYRSNYEDYLSVLQEESVCDTQFPASGGSPITGTVSFEKRTLNIIAQQIPGDPLSVFVLKNIHLGDPLPTAAPVKYAEVAVYNSQNERVQCGITNGDGEIKALNGSSTLIIPYAAGTYTLRVIARSHINYNGLSDYVTISVKEDKYKNSVHAVSTSFYSSGNNSININLVAKARQSESESVLGGAFNILNTLQLGLSYIGNTTSTQCLANKKVSVFWKAGFNPMQYDSPQADPQTLSNTSYYDRDTKALYISGGQLGDISLANTDHYDDFVILHEMAHLLEDQCGSMVSPGGGHNLTYRIDPRLAWSEGWANFLAAHILNKNIDDLDSTLTGKLANLTENSQINYGWTYFFNSNGLSDSVQNIQNGDGWFIDFKKPGTNPGSFQFAPYTGQEFDKVNPTAYAAEGHFREGAISRGLFKLLTECGTECISSALSFEDIWDAYINIASTEAPYFGSDKILKELKNNLGVIWTSGVRSAKTVTEKEALHLSVVDTGVTLWPGYARSLTVGGGCSLAIQARPDSAASNFASDQRYSNHFYVLPANVQSVTVAFNYSSGSNNIEHDLLVFKPGYFFNDDYSCQSAGCTTFTPYRGTNNDVVASNRNPTSGTTYSKTVILPSHLDSTQKYLLDIRAWTAGKSLNLSTKYTYSISSNLGALCPQ